MKQPEDTKTIDFLDSEKRGRGRPAKADKLTPAERAKRYRKKQQAAGAIKRYIVTKNEDATNNAANKKITRLMQEIERLIAERAAAYAHADTVKRDLAELALSHSGLRELLKKSESLKDFYKSETVRLLQENEALLAKSRKKRSRTRIKPEPD